MSIENTPLQRLKEAITAEFPLAVFSGDEPAKKDGTYWLDTHLYGKTVSVEWNSKRGFGFYAPDSGYGERPNSIIHDTDIGQALEFFKNRLRFAKVVKAKAA